jgi:hypothetical protein
MSRLGESGASTVERPSERPGPHPLPVYHWDGRNLGLGSIGHPMTIVGAVVPMIAAPDEQDDRTRGALFPLAFAV